MKVDLRKFRFWYISHLIKCEATPCIIDNEPHMRKMTRKEANIRYLNEKKIGGFSMMGIYKIHLERISNGLPGFSHPAQNLKTPIRTT